MKLDELYSEVDDKAVCYGYTIRDGFVFTSFTKPLRVFDAIVIRQATKTPGDSFGYPNSLHSLEEHIALINEFKIEKAVILAESLDFIELCPTLVHLRIIPAHSAGNKFDYSPLYKKPLVKSLGCLTKYGVKQCYNTTIECDKINGLEEIVVTNSNFKNYEKIKTLKSIEFENFTESDLNNAFGSDILDTIYLCKCKIESLDGIEKSKKMQCLYLYYHRKLRDINALKKVKNTLKTLRIENCPKIEDFSVLGELDNLELLELKGSNKIPSLDFLRKMKNLKTFLFNMEIEDGDLSPCLNLSYVYSSKNRKYYNLKDKDLPKLKYVRGNESIDVWRQYD